MNGSHFIVVKESVKDFKLIDLTKLAASASYAPKDGVEFSYHSKEGKTVTILDGEDGGLEIIIADKRETEEA